MIAFLFFVHLSQSSSTSTRQSIETIERINNENIRLHDEVKEIRHSLVSQSNFTIEDLFVCLFFVLKKMTQDENGILKRQVEELREQLSSKDVDLKNYHRTIADLEQQLTEAENVRRERRKENEFLLFNHLLLPKNHSVWFDFLRMSSSSLLLFFC